MSHEGPEEMDLEVGIRSWARRVSTSWGRVPGPTGIGVRTVIGGGPLSPGCRGGQSQIRHGELGVLPAIVGGRFAPVTALTSDYNQGDRNNRW